MNPDLFLGEFEKISKMQYANRVLELVRRSEDAIYQDNKFELLYNDDKMPEVTKVAVNFINNFELVENQSIVAANYCELIDLVNEMYAVGIHNSSIGDISKKDYTVMKPSFIEGAVNYKCFLSDLLRNNTEAFKAIGYDNYSFFINDEGTPMAVPSEEVYPMHEEWLNEVKAQRKKELERELMEREPPKEDFA